MALVSFLKLSLRDMCKAYLRPFQVMINLSLCKTIHSEREGILGDFVLNS